jgi:hypothetical protein
MLVKYFIFTNLVKVSVFPFFSRFGGKIFQKDRNFMQNRKTFDIFNKRMTRIFHFYIGIFFVNPSPIYLIFLLTSLAQCSNSRESVRLPGLEDRLENSDHFQKNKIGFQDNTFEDGGYRIRYLMLRKSKSGATQAKELEVSLFSYSDTFLKNASRFFAGKTPKKFLIQERIKQGTATKSVESDSFEVHFQGLSIRQVENDDLSSAIEDFLNSELPENKEYHEIVKFQLKKDGSIWKKEESRTIGKKKLSWKNYEEGGLIKRFAYIEFFSNEKEISYSKLHSPQDYLFQIAQKNNIKIMNRLFQNKDYLVYYFPDSSQSMEPAHSLILKNNKKRITLLKNKFPILLYKKNLNFNEQ